MGRIWGPVGQFTVKFKTTSFSLWSVGGAITDNVQGRQTKRPVSQGISRWPYDPDLILTHRAVQAGTLIMWHHFGADLTKPSGVMTTSSPLAKEQPSPNLNVSTVWENRSQFGPWSYDLSELIWAVCCKAASSSASKYETCHFLPAGGAVMMSQYWHMDLFGGWTVIVLKSFEADWKMHKSEHCFSVFRVDFGVTEQTCVWRPEGSGWFIM